jgi:hypothetical protein
VNSVGEFLDDFLNGIPFVIRAQMAVPLNHGEVIPSTQFHNGPPEATMPVNARGQKIHAINQVFWEE